MGYNVKCIYCRTETSLVYQNVKSNHNGSKILLNNTPMHYCPRCKDSILSLEAIEAFKYVKTLPLKQEELNTFDYKLIMNTIE